VQADVWAITRRSLTHRVNEDRAVVGEAVFATTEAAENRQVVSPAVLAVLDGVGGHAAGDVASDVAAKLLAAAEVPRDEEDAAALLKLADRTLHDAMRADPGLSGMGSTVAMIVLNGADAIVANVGDSSVWHLAGGQLTSLATSDRIGSAGIAQCLGAGSGISPHVRSVSLQAGDRLLLATDGLTDVVPADVTRTLLGDDVRTAADRMLDLVERARYPDDVSIVVAEVVESH
jgi:PPM family protein phosphatase